MPYKIDAPSWITNSSAWMKPVIANIQLPGTVYLKECGIKLRHQKNKKNGTDYGSVLIQGLEIPDFEFEILIRTLKEEQAWENISALFLPRKRPTERDVLPVFHPMLVPYDISSCVVVALNSKLPVAGGPMTVTIGCVAVSPEIANATKLLKITGSGGKGAGPNYKSPEALNFDANLPSRKETDFYAPQGSLK